MAREPERQDTGWSVWGGKRRWLALLLSLALVRGLIYLSVIPPWQAPDETGHFEYAWLIAHLGRLPTANDLSAPFERELLGSLYEWRYGEFVGRSLPDQMPVRMDDLPLDIFARNSRTAPGRFSLAYVWAALLIWPFRYQDLVVQLYSARLASVLLQLGIIWLAWRTFEELLPGRMGPRVAMTALIVFMPQHTFVNSTVGDGAMAELMACLALYGWVRVMRQGRSYWDAVWIVLGTLASIWSKKTALFLLPLDAALIVWWTFHRRQWRLTLRQRIVLAAGVTALIPTCWLFARSPAAADAITFIRTTLMSRPALWTDPRGFTLGDALLATYDSLWAYFGWMTAPASPRWQGAILLLTLAAVLGWVIRSREEFPVWTVLIMGGAFLTAVMVFVWTMLLFSAEGYYHFQGRYLFPAIVPFAFLLVGGWMRVFPSWRPHVLMRAGVAFFVLFDMWCMLGTVVPYFYLH